MSVTWLNITFPRGVRSIDRNYGMELPEHHYFGSDGDEHEDGGFKATVIRCEAELMTTYQNGNVDKTAEAWFEDLLTARNQRKSDILFLDNGGSHLVWLRNFNRRDRGPNMIELQLEFVETLDENLALTVLPPTIDEKIETIQDDLVKIQEEAIEENIPVDKRRFLARWNQVMALYNQATEFVARTTTRVNDLQDRINSIQNLGAGLGRELDRLSADVGEMIGDSQNLFNSLATNPLGTFAIGRSVMDTINNLKAINIGLSPPPRSQGKVARGLIRQPVSLHKVAGGESLQAIAKNVYGSSALWTVIADANDLGDPMSIEAGTELVIPVIPEEQIHGTCKKKPNLLKTEFTNDQR